MTHPETYTEANAHWEANRLDAIIRAGLAESYPDAEALLESDQRWPVVVQEWLESELGWGTRPDGCSLHRSPEQARQFIELYWDSMPDEVPDEYSAPLGAPGTILVDAGWFARLQLTEKPGFRLWEPTYREIRQKATV